jgi:pimeloyl-ACP methyl ester carboxylesterase
MARGEKVRRWAKRILLGLVALVVVLVIAGAVYEAISRWRDGQRFHPPEQLVDLGGRRIHLHCVGSGSPTVVLESGLGMPAMSWRKVQPGVAAFATVCSYDRAGYGYSDAGPMPRTLERRVEDLHAALRAGGRPPPYVLVAHSAGGSLARGFRHRYPGEVAGVVLVDASHEQQFTRSPASFTAMWRDGLDMDRLQTALAPLGLPRLLAGLEARGYPSAATMADELVALIVRAPAMEATHSEAESFQRGGEVPAGATLGDLPLVVLTAGRAESWGLPEGDAVAMRKLWVDELQPELARLSTRGRRVIVEGSGHQIPIEQPRAVVEAVREVVDASRPP